MRESVREQSDKECARTNQWGHAAGRLPTLLMQVKASKVGAMSLIVLSGSIG
jgi:hypothetical protein